MLRTKLAYSWGSIWYGVLFLEKSMAKIQLEQPYTPIEDCQKTGKCISTGNAEAGMTAKYIQDTQMKAAMGLPSKECEEMRNQSLEGRQQPAIALQKGRVGKMGVEDQMKCMAIAKKIEEDSVNAAMRAYNKARAHPNIQQAEEQCVNKLDDSEQVNCIYNKKLDEFKSSSGLIGRIMKNVAQLWYRNPTNGEMTLLKALVVEPYQYNVKPAPHNCSTNFHEIDLSVSWNMLGLVNQVTGRPSVRDRTKCSQFCGELKGKAGATLDGNNNSCRTSCKTGLASLNPKHSFIDTSAKKPGKKASKRKTTDN